MWNRRRPPQAEPRLRGGALPVISEVEASDERSADAAAAVQFDLDDEQRKRVAVQEIGAS